MFFVDWLSDYTLRTVAMGAGVLGVTAGVLGSFAVLRKQSLLGDAISHAALPGIALAFMLTGSKAPLVLVLGATLSGWLGALAVMAIVRTTRIKEDAALGMMLSVLFGAGLVLLTYIQRSPDAAKAGLDTFLFGQAAALLQSDVITMAVLGGAAIVVVALFWKEFKLLSFDPDFGAVTGFRMRTLDILLTTLIVVAIVIGLQAVGVVLMSAMVVAPAAAARQWTNRLSVMVLIAAFFGLLAGTSGALLSSSVSRLPTGPTVVLAATVVVVISFLLAPARGLVPRALKNRRNRTSLRIHGVLADLDALAEQHVGEHAHPVAVLETMSLGRGGVQASLEELEERGLARRSGDEEWTITTEGRAAARRLGDDQR